MNAAMMGHKPRAAYRASLFGRGCPAIIMAHSIAVKLTHMTLNKAISYG